MVEKIPLGILALAVGLITISTQHRSGALKSAAELPRQLRISNAAISYIDYIWKFICPRHLAVFYPLPAVIPFWQAASAAVLLAAITTLTFLAAKRYPYLSVGWLWYVGTLVPVIGLLQVGYQSMADRYTYIPLIGLTMAGSWGTQALLEKVKNGRTIAAFLFTALSLLMLQATGRQLRYWKNSVTLFQHTLSATSDNWSAHNNMSNALLDQPETVQAAADHASEAVRLRPNHPAAYVNLGMALLRLKRTSDAIKQFEKAIELQPDWPDAHQDLGRAFMLAGRVDDAIPHFHEALKLEPEHVGALKALAWIRCTQPSAERRNAKEAMDLARRSAQLTNYKDAEALDVLAAALANTGEYDEAIKTAGDARTLALEMNQPTLAKEIADRLELYRLHLPYRTRL